MKALLPLVALLAAPSLACRSTDGEPTAPSPVVSASAAPPSAYAALVRTLETLDAIRDPDARVRIRAIEADSLYDQALGGEYVRVILDLTVLAPDFDRAEAVFDDLKAALGTEADATARVETVARHRVERVFGEMDWSAQDLANVELFNDVVSISDSIHVEVRRGATTSDALAVSGAPSAESGGVTTGRVDEYLARVAHGPATDAKTAADEAHGDAPIGGVEAEPRLVRPVPGLSDIRYRLHPSPADQPLTRWQIGAFLHDLEAGSPAVRITHVAVTPFEPGTDVRDDEWTFEADMSVRVRDL